MTKLLAALVTIGALLVVAGLAWWLHPGAGIAALGLEIAGFGLLADDGKPA